MIARGRGLATGAIVLALAAGAQGGDVGEMQPGAYCPLPEKGEVPRCLEPAQQAYGAFFGALDESASDAALATVEDAVGRGPTDAQAYLALSSLTYGYYRLAQRAAAEDADPAIALRLSRWNDLLAHAYSASDADPAYRDAVRRAAEDLALRAPVRVPCRDAQGAETRCTSTESVLRGIHRTTDDVGIRGALERLLRRLVGGEDA